MLLPEITIYNIVKTFLGVAKQNYIEAVNKDVTILHGIFNTDDNADMVMFGTRDNFYNMAVELFTRQDDNVEQIQLSIGYNLSRVNSFPAIHILMPTESKGRIDTLGNNQGADPGNTVDSENGVININKTKSKTGVYHLMITSHNMYHVLLIYYFLHAMFLIFDDHVEFKGIRNLQTSGQDINFQGDLSMPNIFHRNVTLQFDYEYSIQVQVPQQTITGWGFTVCADFAIDNNQPG